MARRQHENAPILIDPIAWRKVKHSTLEPVRFSAMSIGLALAALAFLCIGIAAFVVAHAI